MAADRSQASNLVVDACRSREEKIQAVVASFAGQPWSVRKTPRWVVAVVGLWLLLLLLQRVPQRFGLPWKRWRCMDVCGPTSYSPTLGHRGPPLKPSVFGYSPSHRRQGGIGPSKAGSKQHSLDAVPNPQCEGPRAYISAPQEVSIEHYPESRDVNQSMMGSLNLREYNRRKHLRRASCPFSCLWSEARCQSRPTDFKMGQEVQAGGRSEEAAGAQAGPGSGRVPTLLNPPRLGMCNILLTAPPDCGQELTDIVRRHTCPVPECSGQVAEKPMPSVSMRSHGTESARSKPTTRRTQSTAWPFPCLSFRRPHVKVAALCDGASQWASSSRVSVSQLRRPSLFQRPLSGRVESGCLLKTG